MHCPSCHNADTKVVDSRLIEEGSCVRRRRQCEYCEHRFTTHERKEFTELVVVKKTGGKELYNRAKLKRAILLSAAKRNIDAEVIDQLIAKLESKWSSEGKEIASQRIGNDVVAALKEIDPVAYVRFASVYGKFHSLEDFKAILG